MEQAARAIEDIRLNGGRPCVDFVNTIHDRNAAPQEDYLTTPERLLAWAARAGLVHAGEKLAAPTRADQRARLMSETRRLREAVHALLSARIEGTAAPQGALRTLDRWVHAAWKDLVLTGLAGGRAAVKNASRTAKLVLMRASLCALDLLSGEQAANLKCCPECGWLFLDTSKNGSRRWCSMETCGAVVKMRNYRKRSG